MDYTINVKVKTLSDRIGADIKFPHYATAGSAGIDLPACLSEPLSVSPGKRVTVPTGIAIDIPDRHIVGLVFPRSGLATKHGISLANAVGVIDSDYKGEILAAIYNQSDETYIINPGERIAQLLFLPVYHAMLEQVTELSDSKRGAGGFGSTGK
ncbi:MAG: dUTP diphosphatase [Peptococcaceae bacterium]|nr:dUTP diphosphatase [Peptococcaceae bacterium]